MLCLINNVILSLSMWAWVMFKIKNFVMGHYNIIKACDTTWVMFKIKNFVYGICLMFFLGSCFLIQFFKRLVVKGF